MREILFRSKRLDNREWIIGHLLKYEDGAARIVPNNTDIFCFEKDESIIQTIAHRVDPKTVGQYTGFVDKNGKKIFEGDVLKMNNTDLKCGAISFMRGSFCLTSIEERVIYRADIGYIEQCGVNCAEVIGNIYDNPELIKERE